MMKKKLFLLLLAVMPFAAPAQWPQTQSMDEDAQSQLQKFENFYKLLSGSYIDSIPNHKLIEKAIKSVLAELDPHSVYLSSEELKSMAELSQGNFSGVGLETNILQDTLMVVNTVADGPSEKVGIMPNDKIIGIDGVNAVGITDKEATQKLRGPRGTPVVVTVVRHGVDKPMEFRIMRDIISLMTVDAAYNVDKNIGYIRVNRFAETTMTEFREAMRKIGYVESLILDLRGNGGGLISAGVEMSNYFLNRGNRIVSTEGMHFQKQHFNAPRGGEFNNGKVVVLIDEYSASASEIVTGALQDWDRAVIVGRRSFGKGLVQQESLLQDSSAVRITVARYLTPTGRAIQRPFQMGHTEEYYQNLAKRFSERVDTINVGNENERYKTLRLGRTVYGGGGIYPDYYVAVDTTVSSGYLSKLYRMGLFNEFVASYLDRNRTQLESTYSDFETFNRDFVVGDDIMGQLIAMGESRGIALDPDGLARSGNFISIQLKAMIARQLWDTSKFYEIVNTLRDPIYNKALEILRNWDKMSEGIVSNEVQYMVE